VDHHLKLADGQRLVATSTRREVSDGSDHVTIGVHDRDVILLAD
jgi:hypothetical protein